IAPARDAERTMTWMHSSFVISMLALFWFAAGAGAADRFTLDNQKRFLKEILRTLPKSEPWERWVHATGALPPDFNSLPDVPFLPDPLRFANGKEVKKEDWPKRRLELLA